jgi:hypothetical protein
MVEVLVIAQHATAAKSLRDRRLVVRAAEG